MPMLSLVPASPRPVPLAFKQELIGERVHLDPRTRGAIAPEVEEKIKATGWNGESAVMLLAIKDGLGEVAWNASHVQIPLEFICAWRR